MYQKVSLIVENEFISLTSLEFNNKISVYNRVFEKLSNEKGSLGKVMPIYLKVNDTYKILGILTINKGGSYSFFPELPGNLEFDHITFVKNLNKNNHHFTRRIKNGREKVLPLHANLLDNGIYHGLTLIFKDISILKDVPRKIMYPEVDVKFLPKIKEAFLNIDKPVGSSVIEVNDGDGVLCVQLFLIPRNVDYRKMDFFVKSISRSIPNLNLEKENGSPVFNNIIFHEFQNDYVFGIKTILLRKNLCLEQIAMSWEIPNGYYSKMSISGLKI